MTDEDLPEVNHAWDYGGAPGSRAGPTEPRPSPTGKEEVRVVAPVPGGTSATDRAEVEGAPRRHGWLWPVGAVAVVVVVAALGIVLMQRNTDGDGDAATEANREARGASDHGADAVEVIDEPLVVRTPGVEVEVGDAAQTVKVRGGRVWVNAGTADGRSRLVELDADTGDILREHERAPFSVHFDIRGDRGFLGELDLGGLDTRLEMIDLEDGTRLASTSLGITSGVESGFVDVLATPEVVWAVYSGPDAGNRVVGWAPDSGELFSLFGGEFGAAVEDGRGIGSGETLVSFSGDAEGAWVLSANWDPMTGGPPDDARYTLWHQDGSQFREIWSLAVVHDEDHLIGVLASGDRALVDGPVVRVVDRNGAVVSEQDGSVIPWFGDAYNRDGTASPTFFVKEVPSTAGLAVDLVVFDDEQRPRVTLVGAGVNHFIGQPYAWSENSLWTADDEEGIVTRWDFELEGAGAEP